MFCAEAETTTKSGADRSASTKRFSSTLEKLKKAADTFSGQEKPGVHAIVLAKENVIDVEVRLDASRLDIAALEQRPEGIELVFWEAKHLPTRSLVHPIHWSHSVEYSRLDRLILFRSSAINNERLSEVEKEFGAVLTNLKGVAGPCPRVSRSAIPSKLVYNRATYPRQIRCRDRS
jgi:hypothetical protein